MVLPCIVMASLNDHVSQYHSVGEILVNLANCELFTNIFLTNVHRYCTLKMYLVYALTVTYLSNFSSPITFTCTVRQNFPLAKYLSYLVHCKTARCTMQVHSSMTSKVLTLKTFILIHKQWLRKLLELGDHLLVSLKGFLFKIKYNIVL